MITGSLGSSYFEYDDGHQRVWQHATGSSGVVDTTYIGGFYEKVDDANTTKHKCYIASPTGRIAIYTQTYDKHTFGTTYDTKYCHRDHLGSVDVITDSTGAVLERDSFDAWGFRRTTDWQAQRPIGSTSLVSRGFTDHEELDSLGLVNMNGRIYDPGIGRFVSADPFVQAPTVTQNFNRYSYVVNNPLSFTDPSGFNFLNNFGKWLDHVFGSSVGGIIKAVISYAVYIVTYAVIAYVAGPFVAAIGAGFTSGFLSSSLSGASLGQALQAGGIMAGIAGLTQGLNLAVFQPLGAATGPGVTGMVERGLLQIGHAAVTGALWAGGAAIQGASVRDAFVGAAVSSLLSPSMNGVGGDEGLALRIAMSAVAGGTAAVLTGGKFANGAVTGAFVRLFQEEIPIQAVGKVLKGVVDLLIGKDFGAEWRRILRGERWITPKHGTGGSLPETLANGVDLASSSAPPDAFENGFHAWHAGSNAFMAQQLGLIGAPLIFLAGVFHEIDFFSGSFFDEQRNQGTINHFLDSVTDIVANTFGMTVGYAGGSVSLAARWGNYIPGPTDPDPNFGNRPLYNGNPFAAWGTLLVRTSSHEEFLYSGLLGCR